MDIVINLEKTKEGTVAKVKKSRLANLPDTLPVQNFNSILEAIDNQKASSIVVNKENDINKENNSINEVFESVIDEIKENSSTFNYDEMKRLEEKHKEKEE